MQVEAVLLARVPILTTTWEFSISGIKFRGISCCQFFAPGKVCELEFFCFHCSAILCTTDESKVFCTIRRDREGVIGFPSLPGNNDDNEDDVVDEAALRIKYLGGKMGLERGKSPQESRTTPIDNSYWGTFQAGNITNIT